MKINYKKLGKRIQSARKETGLSQEQLAEAIGKSPSAVSTIETGKRDVYKRQDQFKAFLCILVKLAQGVDISEEAILFVDNTIRPLYSKQKLESVLFDLREEEEFHVPMDFESDICAAIEDGNASVLERRLQTPTSGRVGRMSANALQQQKYAFISFATLISRAAIRGGLPNEVA